METTTIVQSLGSCSITQGQILYNQALWLADKEQPFGKFIKQAYRQLDWHYPKFHKMDRLCKLATVTARILLQNGVLEGYKSEDIAIVIANKTATYHTDSKHIASIQDRDHYYPSPAVFVYTLPNILVGELSIQYKIKGASAFFIQEEKNLPFLFDYSQLLLESGAAKICLTGWVEYTETHYNSELHLLKIN
ncbi:MAG: 3-oxoacyl-ACP synthase [Aureispira sp.]